MLLLNAVVKPDLPKWFLHKILALLAAVFRLPSSCHIPCNTSSHFRLPSRRSTALLPLLRGKGSLTQQFTISSFRHLQSTCAGILFDVVLLLLIHRLVSRKTPGKLRRR